MNRDAIMAELQSMKRCIDNIVRLLDGQPIGDNRPVPVDDGKPFTDDSIMPFGKYVGQKLKFLPPDYVQWMREQPAMKNKRLNDWLHPSKAKKETAPPNEFLADEQIKQAMAQAKEEGII